MLELRIAYELARLDFWLVCLLLATQFHAPSHQSLAGRIEAVLSEPLLDGFWGIEVVSLSTGKVLYAQKPTSSSPPLPIPSCSRPRRPWP